MCDMMYLSRGPFSFLRELSNIQFSRWRHCKGVAYCSMCRCKLVIINTHYALLFHKVKLFTICPDINATKMKMGRIDVQNRVDNLNRVAKNWIDDVHKSSCPTHTKQLSYLR